MLWLLAFMAAVLALAVGFLMARQRDERRAELCDCRGPQCTYRGHPNDGQCLNPDGYACRRIHLQSSDTDRAPLD